LPQLSYSPFSSFLSRKKKRGNEKMRKGGKGDERKGGNKECSSLCLFSLLYKKRRKKWNKMVI
jgi:hypothetical protein